MLLVEQITNQGIVLLSQMFLFGLCLVDFLCSPSIHLPLQLFFLSDKRGQQERKTVIRQTETEV